MEGVVRGRVRGFVNISSLTRNLEVKYRYSGREVLKLESPRCSGVQVVVKRVVKRGVFRKEGSFAKGVRPCNIAISTVALHTMVQLVCFCPCRQGGCNFNTT